MHYPRHIAIIPDGNRTRAREQGLEEIEGHMQGAQRGMELIKYVFTHTPIDVMTGWGLSTENVIGRSPEHVNNLCHLFTVKGDMLNDFLAEHRINFRWIGSPVGLPTDFVDYMEHKAQQFSYPDSPKTVIFAINYGGRDEILRGIHTLIDQSSDLSTLKQTLTDTTLGAAMDLGGFPPVELVIRTKGNLAQRTSGFMSRWIGYAELYFTALKYPEFDVAALQQALHRYDQVYEYRNFGK